MTLEKNVIRSARQTCPETIRKKGRIPHCLPLLLCLVLTVSPSAGVAANPGDTDWSIATDSGNTIQLKDGTYELNSFQHTYSLLTTRLERDNVRVSAEIKSAGGRDWAPGITLYWDTNNWVRMMVGEDAGFCSYEMIDGVLTFRNLSTYQGNEYNAVKHSDLWVYDYREGGLRLKPIKVDTRTWHYLGFELRDESILYLSGTDGQNWTLQRLGQRTGVLKSPPQFLLVGKGFADNQKYSSPLLKNNYLPEKGAKEVAYIRNIQIHDRNAVKANIAANDYDRDVLGAKELAKDGDPSFESVSRYFPELKYGREAIGVKDHPKEFSVLVDAALVEHQQISYLYVNDTRFGKEPDFPRKALLKGYLPYIVADWTFDGLQLQQSLFAWSEDMSTDKELFGFIKLTVKNTTAAPKTVSLKYVGNGIKNAQELNEVRTYIATWQLQLRPGEERAEYIKVPYAKPESSYRIKATDFAKASREYVAAWEKILNAAVQIVTPEQRVNNAYKAWLAYNFINVDKINGRYEIHDGNHFYEEIFGYSACLAIQALDWMGYGRDAEAYLESMLPLVDENGLFVVNYGLPDQGALLTALADHYKMTNDAQWLKRVSPVILKMCKWVVSERNRQKKDQDPGGKLYGLLKGRPYCDHPAPAYYYVSDMTITVGMEEAARALETLGMREDAKWIMDEAKDYRKCIMNSMEKALIVHDGMKKLPLFPEDYKLLRAANFNAYDYYGLLIGTLIENNSLPVTSEFANMYVDLAEKKGGLILGLARFWGGIDHAYSYGYWMHCMEKNEIEKVLLGFYSSLAYGMTRNTYSAVEVTFIEDGKNFPTLPHTYSNTQQLRLLRNMLLREDAEGKLLRVGQAIPKQWLEDGKEISVRNAPTLYGNVSYTMKSRVKSGRISLRFTPGDKRKVEKTILYFRHPQDKPIKSVSINKPVKYSLDRDSLLLEGVVTPLNIDVRY